MVKVSTHTEEGPKTFSKVNHWFTQRPVRHNRSLISTPSNLDTECRQSTECRPRLNHLDSEFRTHPHWEGTKEPPTKTTVPFSVCPYIYINVPLSETSTLVLISRPVDPYPDGRVLLRRSRIRGDLKGLRVMGMFQWKEKDVYRRFNNNDTSLCSPLGGLGRRTTSVKGE